MDYTARMNHLYDLNEPHWPSYFDLSDDDVLMRFCWYSEYTRDSETPDQHHRRQAQLFVLWHEIEMRGLYHVEGPALPKRSWVWDTPRTTPDPNYIPSEEEVLDNLAHSITSPARMGASPGRARKIGYNNTPDEENMGLYRREWEHE